MSPRLLSIDLVLVSIDQGEEATRAAEYAVTVVAEYGAAVRAVHVLGEDVVRAIEQGVIDEGTVTEDSKAVADMVPALAGTADVPVTTSVAYGFSRTSKLRHPGSAVLDTAGELDTDFTVVLREPVSGDPGEVFAETAGYVLLYASQPVLSV